MSIGITQTRQFQLDPFESVVRVKKNLGVVLME
jgi:hypothetical protein